jgi:hypothetical protein
MGTLRASRLIVIKSAVFGQGGKALKTRKGKIEWYRERASDCEELAKISPDETARTMLKDMAATWERLASLLEKGELALPCPWKAQAWRTQRQTPYAWPQCDRARKQNYGKRASASRSWRLPHATARCRQIRDSPRGFHSADRRGAGRRSCGPPTAGPMEQPQSTVKVGPDPPWGVGVHWTGALLLLGGAIAAYGDLRAKR